MEPLTAELGLTPGVFAYVAAAVFAAGVVRGFSGFALSALCMAALAFVLSPAEVLGIVVLLEATATLILARKAVGEADLRVVGGLITGVIVGLPLGLTLTLSVPVETSRAFALAAILSLAVAQLFGARLGFLATRGGVLTSGALAGLVQGVSAAGGMVIALFALARGGSPARMRATLVMYLMASVVANAVFLTVFGILDGVALARGLALAPFAAAGVWLGARAFSPRLQPYYRPFCLWLLAGLAAFGLARLAAT